MFDFQEELRKLPDQPGVYIMHDKTDAIIYIGKAVSLRKRVRQYFQPSHDEGIKRRKQPGWKKSKGNHHRTATEQIL